MNSILQYLLVSSQGTDVMDIIVHADILPITHNNRGNRKYFCMEQRGLCLVAYIYIAHVHMLLLAVTHTEGQMKHAIFLMDTCSGRELFMDVNKHLRPAPRNLRNEL